MIPLSLLVYTVHHFISMSKTQTKELHIHGLIHVVDDWNTAFFSNVYLVDGNEECSNNGVANSRDLFDYVWYGLRSVYYDKESKKISEQQCYGY